MRKKVMCHIYLYGVRLYVRTNNVKLTADKIYLHKYANNNNTSSEDRRRSIIFE